MILRELFVAFCWHCLASTLTFYSFTPSQGYGRSHISFLFAFFQLRSGLHHLTSRPPYLLKKSPLFSTHRLIFVNQPPVVACLCSEACKTSLRPGKLVCRLPSLSFKEVHVTQSTISPQINQSCITTQMPYGCHTETEGRDPFLALK